MSYKKYNTYVGPMYLDVEESKEMLQRSESVYEKAKTKMMESVIEPGMTVLDVGANKGWFTCLASRCAGNTGSVYSVEPMKTNLFWLKKTIDMCDHKNVRVLPCALGDCNGMTVFTEGRRSGAHTMEHFPAWNGEQVYIPVNRWDDVQTTQPSVVKIDAECSELRVLSGMRKLLKESKRIIFFIDVHTWLGVDLNEVLKVFKHYGYKIHDKLGKCEVVASKGGWNI